MEGDNERRTFPKLPFPRTLTKLKSSMLNFLTVGRRRTAATDGLATLALSVRIILMRDRADVAADCLCPTVEAALSVGAVGA